MSDLLEQLIPAPRRIEVDAVEVCASLNDAWQAIRQAVLARSPLVKALFELRASPQCVTSEAPLSSRQRLDVLELGAIEPGFAVFLESPSREVTVAAIGKVWQAQIPFERVSDVAAFTHFEEPGWIKVAWSLGVEPRGNAGARISFEQWMSPTDDESWLCFKHYCSLSGLGNHLVRHSLLTQLALS